MANAITTPSFFITVRTNDTDPVVTCDYVELWHVARAEAQIAREATARPLAKLTLIDGHVEGAIAELIGRIPRAHQEVAPTYFMPNNVTAYHAAARGLGRLVQEHKASEPDDDDRYDDVRYYEERAYRAEVFRGHDHEESGW